MVLVLQINLPVKFLGTPPQTISQKISFRNDKHFSVFGVIWFSMNKKKDINIRDMHYKGSREIHWQRRLSSGWFSSGSKGNIMNNAKGQQEQQDLTTGTDPVEQLNMWSRQMKYLANLFCLMPIITIIQFPAQIMEKNDHSIMIINQTNELAGAVGQPWSDPLLSLHHMSTTGL